jgi:hypothetical protein
MIIFPGPAVVGSESDGMGEGRGGGISSSGEAGIDTWEIELSLLARMKCSALRFSPRVDTNTSIEPFGSVTTVVLGVLR